MRTTPLLLIAGLLFAASVAQASDTYKFRLDFTDGWTALLAGPPEVSANFTEEQRARAASGRQFLLTDTSGAHFKWMTIGCGISHLDCELRINSHGSCNGKACDVGFTRLDDETVQVRCYRETCRISVSGDSKAPESKTLKAGEKANFKFGSDFAFSFEGESVVP